MRPGWRGQAGLMRRPLHQLYVPGWLELQVSTSVTLGLRGGDRPVLCPLPPPSRQAEATGLTLLSALLALGWGRAGARWGGEEGRGPTGTVGATVERGRRVRSGSGSRWVVRRTRARETLNRHLTRALGFSAYG